jgi:hypothetical protein
VVSYLWAAPTSGIGLVAAGAWLLFGARGRVMHGALEVSGCRLAETVARLPDPLRFSAITRGCGGGAGKRLPES